MADISTSDEPSQQSAGPSLRMLAFALLVALLAYPAWVVLTWPKALPHEWSLMTHQGAIWEVELPESREWAGKRWYLFFDRDHRRLEHLWIQGRQDKARQGSVTDDVTLQWIKPDLLRLELKSEPDRELFLSPVSQRAQMVHEYLSKTYTPAPPGPHSRHGTWQEKTERVALDLKVRRIR